MGVKVRWVYGNGSIRVREIRIMLRGMLKLLVMLAVLPPASAAAERGRVETKDGKTYEGEITRDADGVVINRDGIKLRVKTSEIRVITPVQLPRDEYEKRAAALKPDDTKGHYELALWCKDNELWDLVATECKAVLKSDPEHPLARPLLTMAQRSLASSREKAKLATPGPEPQKPGPESQTEPADMVTAKDIQRVRFVEIILPNPDREDVKPDQVPIRFLNDALKRFWEEMKGTEGFKTPEDRQKFFTMKAIDQLGEMYHKTGRKYQPDVEIQNDPRVFVIFKTRLWPILSTGCATSNCHAGPNATSFRLHTGPARTPEQVYTNFLILDSIKGENGRLINRDRVEESLLLHYGLPEKETKNPHPGKITPIFRNANDPKYKMFEDWIYLLRRDPDYGVKVPGRPQEPEQAEPKEAPKEAPKAK